VRTCGGRHAAFNVVFPFVPDGVKSDNERLYIVVTKACGASVRIDRKDSGNEALESGGDEYTVVSNVMRRMSHFLRSSDKESVVLLGGFKIANAD